MTFNNYPHLNNQPLDMVIKWCKLSNPPHITIILNPDDVGQPNVSTTILQLLKVVKQVHFYEDVGYPDRISFFYVKQQYVLDKYVIKGKITT